MASATASSGGRASLRGRASLSGRKLNAVTIGDIVIIIIITLLCMTCILPFIHLAAKSVSSNTAVLSKKVFLWPKGFTLSAYQAIFRDGQLTRSMFYSVEVTVLFTIIGMIATTCAAYPLSVKRLRGRSAFSLIILFTLYFTAGLIPEYLLLQQLGILNTMWALVLPLAFSPYNMLIMKSFLEATIPDSLEEAAFLDGANHFQILLKIILPLSKPILATLSLFYAVGRWNAYADAKYYITKKALQPIQYMLYNMILNSSSDAISLSESAAATSTPEVLQSATVMFATLPIICIYPFVQKYFVKGVMIGAVKG
ncbi:MAG: carbohydrate ABC transporter permease [Clostridiales bacterium]|jgi:putative aldouronate transport system permease protein|nr:carbohydrate ABC transporter permease [Clostridiales bacterium]